jgi:hypothetical protein
MRGGRTTKKQRRTKIVAVEREGTRAHLQGAVDRSTDTEEGERVGEAKGDVESSSGHEADGHEQAKPQLPVFPGGHVLVVPRAGDTKGEDKEGDNTRSRGSPAECR